MENIKNKFIALLRWSEKYTKTDMVYLAKGGFWATTSQICVSLMTFLLAIAFAHYVSKEAYGEYKYVLSVASILGAFTLSGLGTAVLQSVSRGYEGTLRYAFWKNIRWSTLFFLGATTTALYYLAHGNASLGISMLLVGCLWPFFTSTNLYSNYLIAKKDFKRSSIYFFIIGNLFPSLCLFATMLITSSVAYLIAVYTVSNTIIGAILYIRILKIYKPNKEVDPEMLGYGKHLSLINILIIVGSNIDQILAFHYIGAVELAIYNFAIAIPDQIKGPMKNLTGLIFPKFTERSDTEIRSGMKNKFLYLFIGSAVLIIVYILVSPYIFHIFFPKYTDSIFYSQIFSLSLLWMSSIPAETYLSAKKKIKELYLSNILIFILQIILMSFGVIFLGLLGLVLARVITRLSTSAVNILFYNKASKEAI
jgi:O-antigen/teichoic acid export membrane protein